MFEVNPASSKPPCLLVKHADVDNLDDAYIVGHLNSDFIATLHRIEMRRVFYRKGHRHGRHLSSRYGAVMKRESSVRNVDTADAEIVPEVPLRLVELRGDAPARMGIPSDALRASSHRLGQGWSAALWSHDERPDGLVYSSRLNEDANVVIYDRALPKLRATATPRLLECRSELASVLRDLAVALI